MGNILSLKIGITAIIGCLFAALIASGFSPLYIVGILFVLILAQIFISHLLYFLFMLLLLRPAIDSILLSIRFSVGGIDIGLGGIVNLFLVLGAIFYILITPHNSNRLKLPIIAFYAMFCFVYSMSLFTSPEVSSAVKILLGYFSVLAILIMVIGNISSEKDAGLLLKAIPLSAIIPIVVGTIDYLFYGGYSGEFAAGRFVATFSHPNVLAFFLLIVIGCLFFQIDNPSPSLQYSFWRIVCILILISILVIAETRSAWMAFVLMGAMYAVFFNRKWIMPGIGMLIVLSFVPLVQQKVLNIFSSYGGQVEINEMSSFGWRLNKWYELLHAGLKKPFLGHGILSPRYLGKDNLDAHNDYIRFFVESGFIGVLAYFLPYFYVLTHAVKNYQSFEKNEVLQKLASFFICFIPAFLLMSISENLAGYVIIHWYFWGLIGIYFRLISIKEKASVQYINLYR